MASEAAADAAVEVGRVRAPRAAGGAPGGRTEAGVANPPPAAAGGDERDILVVLLGGFGLFVDRRTITIPLSAQRVIALLALQHRAMARSEVSGTLWPEATESQANGCLRTALWRLRCAEPALIAATSTHINLAPCVRTDTRELVCYAHRLLDVSAGLDSVLLGVQSLLGELLPGWHDDWVVFERERMRQLALHALEALADRLLGCRRFGPALEAAHAAIRSEPLRESAHRIIIQIHLAEGNDSEALRAYRFCADLFGRELGLPPSAHLTALVRRFSGCSLGREPRGGGGPRPGTDRGRPLTSGW
jgi:DNA-binding SARP family transcriptional activator